MMGGKNIHKRDGEANAYSYYLYDNAILSDRLSIAEDDDFEIFTLQDFLEKFPYKVGDKVHIYVQNDDIDGRYNIEVAEITSMRWNPARCKIAYKMKDINREFYTEEIKCKAEESMEDKKLFGVVDNSAETKSCTVSLKDSEAIDNSIDSVQFIQSGKIVAVRFNTQNYENEVELQLDDYEIEIRNGKTYAICKKPKYKYPTTYDECCKILGCKANHFFTDFSYNGLDIEISNYEYKINDLLRNFRKLRYCRDAYWKIAGEEMGIGKSWEPDWTNLDQLKYCIWIDVGEFITMINVRGQHILAFPTAEIRDDFYENFKDLIEQCKEFL